MFKRWFGRGKDEPSSSPSSQQTLLNPAQTGLDKIKSAVALTQKSLFGGISLGTDFSTEEALEALEENLIRSDVGVDLAISLVDSVRKSSSLRSPEALSGFLKDRFQSILSLGQNANQLQFNPQVLNIYLVVGVNGAGKTTLIGKLAHRFVQQGYPVVIGAGDTFRAAAEDQLAVWAQRAGATLVAPHTQDAAAVAYESVKEAKRLGAPVLIVDTAGRLQNKFNLMEELKKIDRVIAKEVPSNAQRETLLVVDATTGQNALRQAEVFHQAIALTGVALTKLDGSAKGGIVLNIAQTYQLPVKLVGVGEKVTDLENFDPHQFVDALFS